MMLTPEHVLLRYVAAAAMFCLSAQQLEQHNNVHAPMHLLAVGAIYLPLLYSTLCNTM